MRKYLNSEHLTKRKQQRAAKLPKEHSMREIVSQIPELPYDQGQEGSCTANAFCAAFLILSKLKAAKTGGSESSLTFSPSREFLYYNERILELQPGESLSDSGADVVDGCAFVKEKGICAESDWSYNDQAFNNPPQNYDEILQKAQQHKIAAFQTISFSQIKSFLCNNYPVMAALILYESFESDSVAKTGKIPLPKHEKEIGGHETLIIGFSDAEKAFIVLNSWGKSWGDAGYFHLPYAYAEKYGTEFTVISL